MNAPDPHSDTHAALREALRRDAARIPEPPFDAALHHATVRRIRSLADRASARSGSPGWNWAALSTASAVGAVCLLAFLWPSGLNRRSPVETAAFENLCVPRASMLAYQRALNGREEAFIQMLDRDAQTLLPPSSPVFSSLLD